MNPIAELHLTSPTTLMAEGKTCLCMIGAGGLVPAAEKREGDGKTPMGLYNLRPGYFRPDHIAPPPLTTLKMTPLSWDDGWCDDPADSAYNRFVKLPFSASHEKLWRTDHTYDLIIPLGYNDSPVMPGRGSAIFLHLMHDDGRPTAGCIALHRADLLALLPRLNASTVVRIG